MTRKSGLIPLCLLTYCAATNLLAQQLPVPQAIVNENPVRISDHVWALMGWPNIGIVVGNRATLVVDTGLGPRNGETIMRVVRKLAPNNQRIYLTTTHYHAEHTSGEAGFPPGAIIVRNAVQQQQMNEDGRAMIERFAKITPLWSELLANVPLRDPDITFDSEASLDLGGITARLFWFGGAHTMGDELTFIQPDRTLISGDVVQNKFFPLINANGGTPATWLAVLDKISALNVLHVLPDHSDPGDGSLVVAEKKFIGELRSAALELKKAGVSAEDAGKKLGPEFKNKYPDYPNLNDNNVTNFVKRTYGE